MFEYYKKTMHRVLLEKKLKEACKSLNGKIIDIGSANRRYDSWLPSKPVAVDITPNKKLQVDYGDLESGLDYQEDSFNGVLCIEVFEYLTNYDKTLGEIKRLLKSDGKAIITTSLTYPDHKDKTRVTLGYMKELLDKYFINYQIQKNGNGFTLLWDIIRLKLFRSRYRNFTKFLLIFFVPYLLVILIFGLHKKEDEFYTGLFITVQKDI